MRGEDPRTKRRIPKVGEWVVASWKRNKQTYAVMGKISKRYMAKGDTNRLYLCYNFDKRTFRGTHQDHNAGWQLRMSDTLLFCKDKKDAQKMYLGELL